MTFAKNLLKLIFAAGVLVSTVSAAGPAGTATFEAPIEISIGDVPDKFGEHAVPRLVDWDSDGDLDLLVGAGDGRVWLVRNQGKGVFANREPVLVDGQPLRLGDKSSTACFANVSGDDKPDLIVAHSDVLVTVFENRGRPAQPMFAQPQAATSNGKPLALPKGCGGRIDAGDWDGDGRTDLVAGAFSGPIVCFHNIGKGNRPEFAPGVPLKIGLEEKSFSYNVHPTLFDVNQDGVCDVAYGMNWGTMGFLTAAPIGHAKNAEA
ncbi:MAG TPA: VCBS repeat-containing protein, partial [Pirellulales bacterium]